MGRRGQSHPPHAQADTHHPACLPAARKHASTHRRGTHTFAWHARTRTRASAHRHAPAQRRPLRRTRRHRRRPTTHARTGAHAPTRTPPTAAAGDATRGHLQANPLHPPFTVAHPPQPHTPPPLPRPTAHTTDCFTGAPSAHAAHAAHAQAWRGSRVHGSRAKVPRPHIHTSTRRTRTHATVRGARQQVPGAGGNPTNTQTSATLRRTGTAVHTRCSHVGQRGHRLPRYGSPIHCEGPGVCVSAPVPRGAGVRVIPRQKLSVRTRPPCRVRADPGSALAVHPPPPAPHVARAPTSVRACPPRVCAPGCEWGVSARPAARPAPHTNTRVWHGCAAPASPPGGFYATLGNHVHTSTRARRGTAPRAPPPPRRRNTVQP